MKVDLFAPRIDSVGRSHPPLADKIDAEGVCWLWTGAHTRGYGDVKIDGRRQRVHRLVYEALVGPIPPGLTIDHLCRSKNCVNPDHMEVVTFAENNRRRWKTKTQCIYGHSYREFSREHNSQPCPECRRLRYV